MADFSHEPMLELFIFETSQLLRQLEDILINSEKYNSYSEDDINEIFRIMHTVKGSSAMMLFNNISSLAHAIEDIFFLIREKGTATLLINFPDLTDLVLKGADFILTELAKIEECKAPDGDPNSLVKDIREFLSGLKKDNETSEQALLASQETKPEKEQKYYIGSDCQKNITGKNTFKAVIFFEDDCQGEGLRAFITLHNLEGIGHIISCSPESVAGEDSDDTVDEIIRQEGFTVIFKTDQSGEVVKEVLMETVFLKHLELEELADKEVVLPQGPQKEALTENLLGGNNGKEDNCTEALGRSLNQSIISVSVNRLDKLMDLVGEMVIAETMVLQNPDLQGLKLGNFQKAASQLSKITDEIQDIVMSIRMVPLSATFHKMNRIVRDMCKKLAKDVELQIIGEETEVDKNIIEHLADPLVHLVRNALDHGIEGAKEREERGKKKTGVITLEAKNAGSDVLVIVKDDGKGLNRAKFIEIAKEKNLLNKPEDELSDREVFNLIMIPGFSAKDSVSEYSGRGVGMDLVANKIGAVGGSVFVDSKDGEGTTITLKIPLTLAIIDGINAKVGNSCYTLPTVAIKEFFRPEPQDIIVDSEGQEMIMVRGQCYPVIRLHAIYDVATQITDFSEGIMIMAEQDGKFICIFADELVGQQQVVVKALPEYIRRRRRIKGLTGCTLLGDGSISLILDIAGLMT